MSSIDWHCSSLVVRYPGAMLGHIGAVLPARLVLYDGVCVVCNRAVQWLLKLDRSALLRFAPLQGETAAGVRQRHPEIPENLDRIVYVENGDGQERVSWHSEAIFRICRDLEAPSWVLAGSGAAR